MRTSLEKLFASKETKIIDVLEIMNQNLLKTAFIVDENKKLLGIVTDGDIRRAILKDVPLATPIDEVMNISPLVAKLGIPEREILNLLINRNILIIPVLDEKRTVVNYYHITDFIKEEFLKNNVKSTNELKASNKVLITGGAGYIGSTLVRILLENGYFVRILDNLIFGKKSVEELLTNPNFELVIGDYTNIEDLIPCLKDVYAVVHLAAIVGDPAGKIDPELTKDTNYRGVKVLGKLCKHYNIERLIFVSTCSVYGASSNSLLTEESALNPVSLYAETKMNAERALLKLKSENFHPCIIRLSTVFGLSYRMRFDLVVNLLTAHVVKNKKISIFSGKQWRPFVHVKDVGMAILTILNQPIEKLSGEVFNIGKEANNYQIEQIGNLMKKLFPEIQVNRIEDKEDDRTYRVSFEKMRKTLNFVPKYNLKDGIKEIAEYLRNKDIDFKESQFSNYRKVQIGVFDSISFSE